MPNLTPDGDEQHSTPDSDERLTELGSQQAAELAHALGAFAVLISTVATLPDHPSMGPVKELAGNCEHYYYTACDVLGITDQNFVAMNRKEGTPNDHA